jgi:hypothetical protein
LFGPENKADWRIFAGFFGLRGESETKEQRTKTISDLCPLSLVFC